MGERGHDRRLGFTILLVNITFFRYRILKSVFLLCLPSLILYSIFQSDVGGDGTKQNSLLNFVMAFHTTSMRAKEALRSFRRRTEASRQEREASGVTPLQSEEPPDIKTDSSVTESIPEAESNETPVVVVSGSEGEKDDTSALEEVEEGQGQHEEEAIPEEHSSVSPGVEEVMECSENESEGGELESDVNSVPAM